MGQGPRVAGLKDEVALAPGSANGDAAPAFSCYSLCPLQPAILRSTPWLNPMCQAVASALPSRPCAEHLLRQNPPHSAWPWI